MEIEIETIAFVFGLVAFLVALGLIDHHWVAFKHRRAMRRAEARIAQARADARHRLEIKRQQHAKNYGENDSGNR